MKKIILFLLTLSTVFTLSGCGKVVEDDTASKQLTVKKDSEFSYLEGMKSGQYYILHADKTYEPVYFGEASFSSGDTTTSPRNERVVWFREDFDKIPYLRISEGDKLICYNPQNFEEKFNWERFEWLGYSLGIRGLKNTKTKRYTLSLDTEDNTLYPRSDADEILNLNNKEVIVESLGEQKLRAEAEIDDKTGKEKALKESDIESELVTRAGTLSSLDQGNNYNLEIYDGTIKHIFNLKADVGIFASWEVVISNVYNFMYDSVIEISLPHMFKSGLYMINGQGVFFYVADGEGDDSIYKNSNIVTALSQDEYEAYSSIKLNDMAEEKEEQRAEDREEFEENYDELSPDKNKNDGFVSEFDIEEEGALQIIITFKDGKDGKDVTAVVETPDGSYIEMDNQDDGSISLSFIADKGHYRVEYINLGDREPVLSFE